MIIVRCPEKMYSCKVSIAVDRGQWEPILSLSRRRGTRCGGSTELPGSWGLMMKGAGGGGGGGWDGGSVEGTAAANLKEKKGSFYGIDNRLYRWK